MKDFLFDQYLDAKDMSCPLPLLKTKQALRHLVIGQVLKVEATDAGSQRDLAVFVSHSTHQMLQESVADSVYTYFICKG